MAQTNKELLEIILNQTKENAKNQLNFAGKVSAFMNEQYLFNADVRSHLESNSKTNQKGLVEQVYINTKDIESIITDKKIERKIWGISGAALGTLGGWVAKFLPFG